MARTLIIGAGGQLGTALAAEFSRIHEVVETRHRPARPTQRRLDLAEPAKIGAVLESVRPKWILIAGAFCHVDRCETETDLCERVNVTGPAVVSEIARRIGAAVVFYSTDHIFDGALDRPYVETDPPAPLNAYARSKVSGEEAVRGILPERHLILRTCGLYGPDSARKNFVFRLANGLAAGETIRVPSDQWGCPTFTEDLARVTRFLLEQGAHGTFHAVGPDFLPRTELALAVCRAFDLDPAGIEPVPTSEMKQPARRPLNLRLSTEKLQKSGAPAFRPLETCLKSMRKGPAPQTPQRGLAPKGP